MKDHASAMAGRAQQEIHIKTTMRKMKNQKLCHSRPPYDGVTEVIVTTLFWAAFIS